MNKALIAVLAVFALWASPAHADDGPPLKGGPSVLNVVPSCQIIAATVDVGWISATLVYSFGLPDSSQSDSLTVISPIASGTTLFGLPFAPGDGTFLVTGSITLTDATGTTLEVPLDPQLILCGTFPSFGPTDGSGFPPGFNPSDIPIVRAGYCTPNGRYINLVIGQDQSDDIDKVTGQKYSDEHLTPAYIDPDIGSTCTYPTFSDMPPPGSGSGGPIQQIIVKKFVIMVCGLTKKNGKWHYVICPAKPSKVKSGAKPTTAK